MVFMLIQAFFTHQKFSLFFLGAGVTNPGSNHYQVMTAKAILHFWTLTACLQCFLEGQRAAMDYPKLPVEMPGG